MDTDIFERTLQLIEAIRLYLGDNEAIADALNILENAVRTKREEDE